MPQGERVPDTKKERGARRGRCRSQGSVYGNAGASLLVRSLSLTTRETARDHMSVWPKGLMIGLTTRLLSVGAGPSVIRLKCLTCWPIIRSIYRAAGKKRTQRLVVVALNLYWLNAVNAGVPQQA